MKIPWLVFLAIIVLPTPQAAGQAVAKSETARSDAETVEGRHRLAVAELRRLLGGSFAKLENSSKTRSFMRDLQGSPERMADLMYSGTLEDPEKAVRILAEIWDADPKGLAKRQEQTTAAAVALVFSRAKWPEGKALRRYEFFRDSRVEGKLNPMFDGLETWEKYFVVSSGPNGGWSDEGAAWGDDSLVWLRDHVKLPASGYTDACWQAPYRLNNLFGDSIHGKDYYAPFTHINYAERVRDVGGVCGSLSHYGANAAQANGIPAFTMGEPGHCAFAVRLGPNQWTPAYSLSWERGLHINPSLRTWTQLVLFEKAMNDREASLRSMAHAFQARAWLAKDADAAQQAYTEALLAQPINYPLWLEVASFMRDIAKPDVESWNMIGASVVDALKDYPECCWNVLSVVKDGAFEKMQPNEREAFLLNFHREIAASESDTMWDYDKALEEQVKSLGMDVSKALDYFQKVLSIQSKSKIWLAPTLAWGQKRYGEGFFGSTESGARFYAMIGEALSGTTGNGEGIAAALGPAILSAEKSGDMEAFQTLGRAGDAYSKPKPKDDTSFPGTLLSSGGLLTISSTSGWDTPLDHWGVLEKSGGRFHTASELRPHVIVRLPKLGELSGVVILPVAGDGNSSRQVPLKVSVSEDGVEWQEVYRSDEAKDCWRIPLRDKAKQVKFVKAERDDDRKEVFHLGAIRVYGRTLQ